MNEWQQLWQILYRPTQRICNVSHLFISVVNEKGFRADFHINRFATFRTRTFQLEIWKNSSSVHFKTRLSSLLNVEWFGSACCGDSEATWSLVIFFELLLRSVFEYA